MNVTEEPTQTVVDIVVILTDGVTGGETKILTALEVTVTGEAQVAFDVIIAITTSPFTNDVVEYEEELVPTLIPFTCH
jgi:hypothetical protein